MKLKIAAIAHFDPLCKERLRQWLEAQSSAYPNPPEIVAVEWDQQIFEQVKSQRSVMRQLVQQEWPNTAPSLLDRLADSLAFEADTHETVFPDVETLWLDQGREIVDPSMIVDYARDRLKVYRSFIFQNVTDLSIETLQGMSHEAWRRVDRPINGGTSRDPKFANLILERVRNAQSDWAIATVGTNHGSKIPGYMRTRLEKSGVNCEVFVLKPNNEVV